MNTYKASDVNIDWLEAPTPLMKVRYVSLWASRLLNN